MTLGGLSELDLDATLHARTQPKKKHEDEDEDEILAKEEKM